MTTRQYDLSAAQSPETVARILRDVAELYRESAGELSASWQDKNAGKCWEKYAAILERAAASCDKVQI